VFKISHITVNTPGREYEYGPSVLDVPELLRRLAEQHQDAMSVVVVLTRSKS
jgi:hypothetical protein